MSADLRPRATVVANGPRAFSPAMLVALLVGIPALVLIVLLAVVGLPIAVAVLVPVLIAIALAVWLFVTAEHAVVGGLALHPATEADEPRLYNMVDGLCDSHGFRRPALFVIDDDARNAVVYGRDPERPSLAVTRGWLSSISRMGLEGLLARELALLNRPSLPAATMVASVSRVLPRGASRRLLRQVSGPHQAMLDDFDAVRLTRYPPGLADALDTACQGATVVRGAGHHAAHLWVAPPLASVSAGDETTALVDRVDALREL